MEFDPTVYCSVQDLTTQEKLMINDEYLRVLALRRKLFMQGKLLPELPTAEDLLVKSGYIRRKKNKHGSTRPHHKRPSQSRRPTSGTD